MGQGVDLIGQAQGARLADTGAGKSLGESTALAVLLGLLHPLFQRITLGDGNAYFDAVIGQTATRNAQAQGNAPTTAAK